MRKIEINEKWLKEQYLEKKRSAQDISKEIGVSNVTILRKLRKLSVKIRTPAEETLIKTNSEASVLYRDRDWLYDQYINQKKHLEVIAREINCDSSILSDWLKRFNIPTKEQLGENCHNWKGRDKSIPYYENKDCPNYLGRHIAERVLSKYFEGVEMMPYKNKGYDFVCKNGYKIDVKSSCLYRPDGALNARWNFDINHNSIADYFLCLAFDNRDDLNPIRLWLIPGKELSHKHALIITNSQQSMLQWTKYEKPIEKVLECCQKVKENENRSNPI
jgi:hypothetical protein